MTIDDYDSVMDLMKKTPGTTFRDADSYENTRRYLERNPELSFIAKIESEVGGFIMSGHDGRRGYLQHLVVALAHRRKGIANALVESCLARLESIGITKSHIDVIKTNLDAQKYWEHRGWILRTDIHRYSFIRNGRENS
ncbi:Acetyltransferase YpeA [Pigmentiphaga humi]|uniref:Acetyltransferase YpeA n=1 Tax=Pigmentiphaga humi TaxID=2478468 RepID=A0A3P4B6E7_9BURK|nr:GNAT family N-acetyltransferase [Pigmentiphaga humi]VCU71867.1 Acetyltransferase YpeA [Pigmentiphaga humi]